MTQSKCSALPTIESPFVTAVDHMEAQPGHSDIRALVRCSTLRESLPRGQSVKFDLESYRVSTAEGVVALRPKEQRLLKLLQESPNRPVGYEVLIPALYGNIPLVAGHIRLRRLVADIRARLGPTFADHLVTIRGVGIIFAE